MFRELFNHYNTRVTVELDEIVKNGVDIWAFDYPSYYEGEEKKAFEQKVLDHFRFRQIGQETVGRWLHMFRTRVREIMPYYIQRYQSVDLLYSYKDPLQSYELTEEYTKDASSTGTLESSTNARTENKNTRKHSDTPQGSIDNLEDYMSDASKEDNENTSETGASSTTTDTGKETYTLRRYGNIGVQPLGDEITKLRSAFLNVDMEVINELNDLFLKVY